MPSVHTYAFFRHDESLPQHLRSFTAGAMYVRILTCGVEVLQFVKHYSEAVQQLEQLIGQRVYQLEYRGRWYDRLALNLDYHLKRPLQVRSRFYKLQNGRFYAAARDIMFLGVLTVCDSVTLSRFAVRLIINLCVRLQHLIMQFFSIARKCDVT